MKRVWGLGGGLGKRMGRRRRTCSSVHYIQRSGFKHERRDGGGYELLDLKLSLWFSGEGRWDGVLKASGALIFWIF